MISIGSDAIANLTMNVSCPVFFVYFINTLAPLSGSFNLFFYFQYSYIFLREKRSVNKWIFHVPCILLFISSLILLGYILTGNFFIVKDGMPVFVAGYPLVCIFIQLAFMIYLPIVILVLNRQLGSKTIVVTSVLGMIPFLLGTLCFIHNGENYILVSAAVSIFLINIFVQNKDLDEREEKYKRELAIAKKKAEVANDAKSAFLFNMSHDIRTPMTAILGFTKLMEKEMDNPEKLRDYLSKVETSGEYLLSIINNVLDIARIDSGEMVLNEEFADVKRAGSFLMEVFSDELKRKNHTLTLVVDVQHRYVIADVVRIDQILINLVSNAIKYTPEGGLITVSVNEVPCEKEGYATFVTTVSDNGIGMSKEFQSHIFDSFTRERNSTDSKVIGTGLGMSIVKKLVDLMGGTIEIESESGKGSSFKVSITERIVDDPAEYLSDSHVSSEDDRILKAKRVLMAEDNDLNAEIATYILTEKEMIVEHASDGVQCIDMLNKAAPGYYDIILMDIQMPNLDGYAATRKIRSLSDVSKASIPIVAMTANAFDEDKQNALNSGMNAHVSKPIVSEKLFSILVEVLSGSK